MPAGTASAAGRTRARARDAASRPDRPPPRPAVADETLAACAHCGLAVRGARPGTPAYCCLGCRMAASIAGGRGELGGLESRLLLSAFLAMGVMTASLVLYGEGLASGAEPGLAAVRNAVRGALALVSLPVLLLLAPPMAAGAWADLRAGRVRMDGLIVVAVGAAFATSWAATWTGRGEVYYETATMVLVLVTLGRRLEARARHGARRAWEALAESRPERALRLAGGGVETVTPDALVAGDRCRVPPHELVPADVTVLSGRGEVTLAHLTGEARARLVGPGERVPAGAVNGEGELLVEVTRPAHAGTLGRLAALVDAPPTLTRTMRWTDRLAGLLVAMATTLALAGGLVHARAAGPGAGLEVALAVLLVSCPCALGLATPLASRATRTRLARRGVLVHDAGALERAARVDLVLFDKTGTLTRPRPRLVEVACAEGVDPERARARMAALVLRSGHPLGEALGTPDVLPLEQVRVEPGRGVRARLPGGVALAAGRPETLGARWPAPLRARLEELSERGCTLVAHAEDGLVRALAAIEHEVRDDARAAVDALAARGCRLEILSGDREGAARRLGERLGVPARGGLDPARKRALVARARAGGATTMVVGDGSNDAPALREGDVGVVVPSGTGLARHGADVELADEARALDGLAVLVDEARALRRTVLGNLAWTLAYNAGALALAVTGRLHPLAAAVLMIASSLVVVARSVPRAEAPDGRAARGPRGAPVEAVA